MCTSVRIGSMWEVQCENKKRQCLTCRDWFHVGFAMASHCCVGTVVLDDSEDGANMSQDDDDALDSDD